MDSATFQKISRIGKIHETEAGPVSRHLNREDESASGAASQRRRPAAIGGERGDGERVSGCSSVAATHTVGFRACGAYSAVIQSEVHLRCAHTAPTLPVQSYLPGSRKVRFVDVAN